MVGKVKVVDGGGGGGHEGALIVKEVREKRGFYDGRSGRHEGVDNSRKNGKIWKKDSAAW